VLSINGGSVPRSCGGRNPSASTGSNSTSASGTLPHHQVLDSIELLGTAVAPPVRGLPDDSWGGGVV